MEEELLLVETERPSMLQRGACALGATCVLLLMLLPWHRQAVTGSRNQWKPCDLGLKSWFSATIEPHLSPQALPSMPVRAVADLHDVQDLAQKAYGTVDEGIYSYGAPGTSVQPLLDLSHQDGCFAGLRVWNEDARKGILKAV